MKQLIIFLLVVVSIFSLNAILMPYSGTTYYVNSNTTIGNDANNGTSTGTPWRTIAKVMAHGLLPGDNVLFSKGQIWKETLIMPSSGNSLNQITFDSYGVGADPIIDGAYTRTNCINFSGKSFITVRGIECRRAKAVTLPGFAGSIWFPSGSTIEGINLIKMNVDSNQMTGIYINTGGSLITARSITIDSSNVFNNGEYGILPGQANPFSIRGIISNSNIYHNGFNSLANAREEGNIQGNLGNFYIFNNNIYDAAPGKAKDSITSHGIYVAGPTTVPAYIYNNWIHDQTNGDAIKARYSIIAWGNRLSHNNTNGAECGQNVDVSAIYIMYNNLADSNNLSGIVINAQQVDNTPTDGNRVKVSGHFFNNVLAYNTIRTGNQFASNFSVDTLEYVNNIELIQDTKAAIQIKDNIATFPPPLPYRKINNNLYYYLSGTFSAINSGVTKNITQWRLLGYDNQGLVTNPLFVHIPTDFHLLAGSPAIDAGLDVGLPFTGTSPDMGAYEFINIGPVSSIPGRVNHNNIIR